MGVRVRVRIPYVNSMFANTYSPTRTRIERVRVRVRIPDEKACEQAHSALPTRRHTAIDFGLQYPM